ncbi:hypothetical protein [Staphylococcus simulans]|uniref:hypothetical protein n=1 Tax=Staphylococcus simulans TaxID=1286 RepID=UPI0021D21236|nr:hypothetical protein [Staphylococcus simulans]UXV43448.1 hypothetical protein MUA12_05785 [Staphylococcus simulans]
MAVDKWTLIGIPADTPIEQAKAIDFVLAGTSEFSHEFENELREKSEVTVKIGLQVL